MRAFTRAAIGCGLLLAAALIARPALALDCTVTPSACPQIGEVKTGLDFWGPMTFKDGGVVADRGRVIYATGQIVDDTATKFDAFLKSAGVQPGALVVFHSPGGSLGVGMEMGESIRKNSLRTAVGQAQPSSQSGNALAALLTAEPTSGVCASACSFAFLGGVHRTVPKGSLYGVHAADLETKALAGTDLLFLGQQLAALMSAYLEEMGIDPGLLPLLANYNSSQGQIDYMQAADMAKLKVTTAFNTVWSLVDDGGVIALVGSNPESSAVPGNNDDLILGCVGMPRRVVMRIDYLPEAYNAGELPGTAKSSPAAFTLLVGGFSLTGFKANSVANGQPTSINIATTDALAPLSMADLHHVTTTIAVTSPIATLLGGSDIVTFSFKGLVAPVGEVNFDLSDGRQEISDYVSDCQ
jgi:hypothetical protein